MKHADAIYAITGVDKNPPAKFVATPSVKRGILTDSEVIPVDEAKASEYRSAVGSAIYLSLEDEMITFAVKELARHLHEPRECDWLDLIRLAKYLWYHSEDVSVQYLDRSKPLSIIDGYCDADWAGATEDLRSTSGERLLVNGFKCFHSCGTQEGLAAMSSGESELRSMSRTAKNLVFASQVAEEAGECMKGHLHSDSSAALANAAKLGPGRMRPIRLQDMYIKSLVRLRIIALHKVPGLQNSADLHTKHLKTDVVEKLRAAAGVQKIPIKYSMLKLKQINQLSQLKSRK